MYYTLTHPYFISGKAENTKKLNSSNPRYITVATFVTSGIHSSSYSSNPELVDSSERTGCHERLLYLYY